MAIILASLLWRTVALPPNDFEDWGDRVIKNPAVVRFGGFCWLSIGRNNRFATPFEKKAAKDETRQNAHLSKPSIFW